MTPPGTGRAPIAAKIWVAGRWELRRAGLEYVSPHWVRRFHRFQYVPGHWVRRF